MAQRIKLDLDSTDVLDFEREVAIPTHDGSALKIPLTFKYRDRLATAAYIDSISEGFKAASAQPDGTPNADAVKAALDFDVQAVLGMVTAWGLEGLDLTADNVRKLCVRYPGAMLAILMDYRISLTQGRLGN